MLTLQCEIRIHNIDSGKPVRFNYANSIVVKTSCKNLTDTATVKVPKKMSWNGKPLTDYVKRNDEISIRVGYKEYGLETVFKFKCLIILMRLKQKVYFCSYEFRLEKIRS